MTEERARVSPSVRSVSRLGAPSLIDIVVVNNCQHYCPSAPVLCIPPPCSTSCTLEVKRGSFVVVGFIAFNLRVPLSTVNPADRPQLASRYRHNNIHYFLLFHLLEITAFIVE